MCFAAAFLYVSDKGENKNSIKETQQEQHVKTHVETLCSYGHKRIWQESRTDSKVDLNTTKVSRFIVAIWGRFRSLQKSCFGASSINSEFWELALEPLGRQDLQMCDKVAKITSKLKL